MGTIYTIKHIDKTYIIDDDFGLDKEIGELYILDSINKTNTIDEALKYMEKEYKFKVLADHKYIEVSGGIIRLEIYNDDNNKPYVKYIEKRDVVGFLEGFIKDNGYDSFQIEYFKEQNQIFAVLKKEL